MDMILDKSKNNAIYTIYIHKKITIMLITVTIMIMIMKYIMVDSSQFITIM